MNEIFKVRLKRMLLVASIALVAFVLINSLSGTQWLLFYDGSIHGAVIDAETREPIKGAIVVGLWELSQFLSQGDGGYAKVSLVQTDKEGKFTIPFWARFKPWKFYMHLHDTSPQIAIYRPGYRFHWSSHGKVKGPRMQMLTGEALEKSIADHSINPALLYKVRSDEDRIQNYHDWGKAGFPGALFPLNHFSQREIKLIYSALADEFSHLPKKKAHGYYLGEPDKARRMK